MRLEIIILAITAFIIYNMYYDGKYLKIMLSWKKYYQMAFVAFMGIMLYLLVRRNPAHTKNILMYANNMVKYMPIDKSSMGLISPIIDFTSGFNDGEAGGSRRNFMDALNSDLNPGFEFNNQIPGSHQMQQEKRIMSSGGKATKRSVSETKKKYVASQQDWKCNGCKQQLNAWFEVDHKVRLEHGGGNEVDNLVALCRECHGKKTAMENL